MHDIADLEGRGISWVFIASCVADGAATQSRAPGLPAAAFVAHPIQDRTDDEMRAMADSAIEDILAAITAG